MMPCLDWQSFFNHERSFSIRSAVFAI